MEEHTDPAYASDAHVPGTDVAWSTIESSLSPRYDYAFICIGAIKLARFR